MPAPPQPFIEYRVRWRPGGVLPGAFSSALPGAGDQLRSCVPLRDHPDPRRLDLRASLRDPMGGLWVRDFRHNAALRVHLLADVSASIGCRGVVDKFDLLRRIAVVVARSAFRSGDAFGFHAAADAPRNDLSLPVRVHRGASRWIDGKLAGVRPTGRSARGLLEVAVSLSTRRSLVFVVSDFLWPDRDLDDIFGALSHHDVVPIVLEDSADWELMPRRGLAVLRDAETGERRFVWLRPSKVEAVRAARERRRAHLAAVCRRLGHRPFVVRDVFDPLALTRHLLEASA